jgi:uncharacterized RDD family membrane protein YckC
MTGPDSVATPPDAPSPAPSAEAPPSPDAWYLAPTGRAEGPVPLSELRARFRDATLTGTTPVRHVAWDDWRPATAVPWLGDLVRAAPVAADAESGGAVARSGASVGVAFRRAGARLVDLTLLSVLAGSVLWGLRPLVPALDRAVTPSGAAGDLAAAPPLDATLPVLLVVALVGVLGEALLLHAGRGRTPGKALFRLRVLRDDGQPARGVDAARRTLLAWAVGLGFGAPLLNLLLPIVQFVRVLDVGRTHYDRWARTRVDVGPMPLWRGVLGTLVVFALIVLILTVLGAAAAA